MARGSLKSPLAELEDRHATFVPGQRAAWWRNAPRPVLLFLIDCLSLTGAISLFYLTGTALAGPFTAEVQQPVGQMQLYLAYGLLSLALLAMTGSYEVSRRGSLARDSVRVFGVTSFVAVLLGLATLPFSLLLEALAHGALLWVYGTFFLLMSKVVGRQGIEALEERGIGCRRIIIVGDHASAQHAAQKLQGPGVSRQVVGLVDLDSPEGRESQAGGLPILGEVNDLPRIVALQGPCEILISATPGVLARMGDAIRSRIPPKVPTTLALYPLTGEVMVQGPGPLDTPFPTVRVAGWSLSWQYERLKRCLDVTLSTLALILAAPVMVLIVVAIKLDSRGPVYFRQIRIGRLGQPFVMYKFRSMRQDAESLLEGLLEQNEAAGPMFKMRRDPRITRVGRIIRHLSLDELPQLFNVLEGNMSLVGPRPPLPQEVAQYQPWHFRRLEAVPGITGLWQVSRGMEISFDEMVRLDLGYIDHWSLLMDVKILFRTVPTVISARGSY